MDPRPKEVTGAVSEILPGSTPSAHRWSPPPFSLPGRVRLTLPPRAREYLAVKFIFFLVEQCNQPWHSQNYATQVERGTRSAFLAGRARRRGAADARMQIARGSSLRRWNLRERRKVERERKERELGAKERESYFDFTSGAICVRKSRHDASKRRIALAAFLTRSGASAIIHYARHPFNFNIVTRL